MDFHDTVMGHRFYESQVPKLISSISKLAEAVEHLDESMPNREGQFLLISVCDREIMTERFSTLTAAQTTMHEEMVQQGKVPADIFEGLEPDAEAFSGEWGFGPLTGYANDGVNHSDFDWLIIEL